MSVKQQSIAAAMAELVALEQTAAKAMGKAHKGDEARVYEWRPMKPPELPAIWNWIDDGEYSVVDTARADDLLVVSVTIAVQPSDLSESMGRLVRLTDVFRETIDPALSQSRPLNDTVRSAKRAVTRTGVDEFDNIRVMCMDTLIRLELTATAS